MWYVIQVYTGEEENTRRQCECVLQRTPKERGQKPLADECCIFYHEERRKIHGEWKTVQKPLFPGYLFISTDDPVALFTYLQHVVGLTKLLRMDESILPLSQKEIDFLMRFAGEDRVVEMSEGIIEGNRIRVLSGPLVGLEGIICKVDRHRRKAKIEVEMFGRKQQIEVGLEIAMKNLETEKTQDEQNAGS